ncbi:MAG: phosphatidate cytidylyltransferase [Bacteroidota bacterium]|nr:phosphatidate cytidylyltransferase [Bacteroidota bacterium]
MNKFNVRTALAFSVLLIVTLSSCQAIAGVFKAGVWFGVIGVVVVIAIILWLINRARK